MNYPINIKSYYDYVASLTHDELLSDVSVGFYLPFLDHNNDYLQVFVQQEIKGRFLITDDGYYAQDLELVGVDLNKGQRKEILDKILLEYKVERDEKDCFYLMASNDDLYEKIHRYVQAIIKITHLAYLNKPNASRLFREYVYEKMDELNIKYVKGLKIEGVSGYSNEFDAIIAGGGGKSEKLISCFQNPDLEKLKDGLLKYYEIHSVRPNSEFIYILDDQKSNQYSKIPDFVETYKGKGINVISKKNIYKELSSLI
jgi:Domain of unknown function DUF1828/Domain of unknown function DUF1829